jgi:hypothetical protein
LFICAAGNGTNNNGKGKENTESSPIFPANYTNSFWHNGTYYSGLPNLISVGSIDQWGNISPFSNYSYQYVDIFAPGGDGSYSNGDILSTVPPGVCSGTNSCTKLGHAINVFGYHFWPGTSMATPMVTGVAALIMSVDSTLTPSQIKQRILQNVDTFPLLCTSHGRLNAYKALLDGKTPVSIRAIPGVTAPKIGSRPVTAITATSQYTGTVAWNPNHSTFAANTQYTATITLAPKTGYTLLGVPSNFFTVDGVVTVANDANKGVVRAEFGLPAPQTVDIAAIRGVTAPTAGATPVSTITGTNQYTGTVSWSPAVAQGGTFAEHTSYTATIILSPKTGFGLQGVPANFFTVAGATTTSNAANSSVVTAVFPILTLFGGGNGSPGTPYLIQTRQHLANISGINTTDKLFKLANNIDMSLSGGQWIPIPSFTGSFDGQGYTISGLNNGLFAVNYGTIKNLNVNASLIINENYMGNTGMIAGENHGVIQNCTSSGTVEMFEYDNHYYAFHVGGIAGHNAGTGSIAGSANNAGFITDANAGGIAGLNSGLIDNSVNNGLMHNIPHAPPQNICWVGGIAGRNANTGRIFNSANNGEILSDRSPPFYSPGNPNRGNETAPRERVGLTESA